MPTNPPPINPRIYKIERAQEMFDFAKQAYLFAVRCNTSSETALLMAKRAILDYQELREISYKICEDLKND